MTLLLNTIVLKIIIVCDMMMIVCLIGHYDSIVCVKAEDDVFVVTVCGGISGIVWWKQTDNCDMCVTAWQRDGSQYCTLAVKATPVNLMALMTVVVTWPVAQW